MDGIELNLEGKIPHHQPRQSKSDVQIHNVQIIKTIIYENPVLSEGSFLNAEDYKEIFPQHMKDYMERVSQESRPQYCKLLRCLLLFKKCCGWC